MKASHQWLRALVPDLPDAKALAARYTAAGLEVEGMHEFGAGTEACVVARVVSMRPHPTKSGLRLVTVDRGGGTQQEVVCGAPNVPAPGGLVVLAPLGAHLPAINMTIAKRAIAGVESEGMLCSEKELGLSEESEGIIVLPEKLGDAVGKALAHAEPSVRDTILEIGLTPNRPDGLGHIGLAREAAALFEIDFKEPLADPPDHATTGKPEDFVTIRIEDGERCPHYAGAVLLDATIGPSPLWMRYRLASLGVRPISNAVDITNFIMLEYGHPMHAFDLDKVRGKTIVVRRAKNGEKLRTLDGVDRTLVEDDLLICDGEGPVALAGVMGGGDSEISASTKKVLLECAYFDPRTVRRSSRRHGLHTESSHRFERGVDHGDTTRAIAHAVELVSRYAGAKAVPGVALAMATPIPKRRVALRKARAEELLGVRVEHYQAGAILKRLGFVHTDSQGDADTFEIPTHRPDVARECDLVEEIARVRGYDEIPAVIPAIKASRDVGGREEWERTVRGAAIAMGLSEAMTYAFVSPKSLAAIHAPASGVLLKNPLGEEQSVMRTSMLPGLLDALGHARRHGERDVRMFALGTLFEARAGHDLPNERAAFAAIVAGSRHPWLAREQAVDVWDAKGLAAGLVERVAKRTPEIVAFAKDACPAHLHPRGAARVVANGQELGRLGPLHPDVIEALDLDGDVMVVEIDLSALQSVVRKDFVFKAIPRFPASTRDLAVVVHDDVPAGDVERAVREAAGKLAEHVEIFDRFVGGSIPKDHASLAFHVVYRAGDRTLTDAEVDAQHAKAVAEVTKRFGAQLRA